MISIKELKTKEDFLKLNKGDKIIFKYTKGKMFFLEIVRIDNKQLVGKPDINYLQETFVDIESLINRDLGRYVDCVVKLN
ncbi:TPA: hypothetical protein ACXDAY_002158 [Clostridium botulinum]|uniref:hypothetical protein n=1 Tax=Clostridium botulinum TaxID=1491 RepID=UPI0004647ACE|nr:hypothetical protein [Clostridium botulinum]APR02444.1 hypothetical protein RSJ2_4030 [Clostridium botulinum]AUN01552.1 hypothetical protein RSJ19_00795 [Clostridium botulinum]MBN3359270.1 hypothetical protein [Clostridium botulinum]QDY27117.1 hypothetical protein CGQ40_20650 [Clostridium botulinum]